MRPGRHSEADDPFCERHDAPTDEDAIAGLDAQLEARRSADRVALRDDGVMGELHPTLDEEATEVRAGMTARVTTAAASGKTFSGKVVRVSRASEVPEQTEIEIEVTSDDGGLRPGMVVEATVGTNPGKDRS